MAKYYTLKINNFECKICLEKSFNEPKHSISTCYKDKPIKYVKVIAKRTDIQTKHDIDEIVPNSEIQHMVCENDNIIILDEEHLKSIKQQFAKNTDMNLLQCISREKISFHMIEGSHYFVTLKRPKKSPITSDDIAIYSVIHKYLAESGTCLVVSYCFSNCLKYGIIYTDAIKGLMFSNLIYSENQRNRNDNVKLKNINFSQSKFTKLFGNIESEIIETPDEYENLLLELISATRQNKPFRIKKKNSLETFLDSDDDETEHKEPPLPATPKKRNR
jgi:hypothetical protein